jgi:hypothetical protein
MPGSASETHIAAGAGSGRRTVIWVGQQASPSFRAACVDREFEIVVADVNSVNAMLPSARAVAIELSDATEFDVVRDLISESLQHGVLVALVQHEELQPDAYYRLAKGLTRDRSDRIIAPYTDWGRIARAVQRFEPGLGLGDVKLSGDLPNELEAQLLVRRAFSDLIELRLNALHGGKSSCDVWIGQAIGEDRLNWPNAFLIKIGPLVDIIEETTRFSRFVAAKRNFQNTPGMMRDRHVEGDAFGLLVQEFVTHARPLREAIQASAPGALVANLFETALDGLHCCGSRVTGSLAQAFADLEAVRWHKPSLAAAACEASKIDTSAPHLPEMQRRFAALPEQSYVRGLIHADLHVDNVFCRASSADVIVIDYAKAVQGPVVADYACLEVSLTFPNLYESQAKPELLALPEDWLRKIYSYPPLASSIIAHDDIADGVMRAVRAIRANMTMREPDQQVYAIALAAYLLRFAAFEDQVIRRRSFAYLLAAMLVARVPAK